MKYSLSTKEVTTSALLSSILKTSLIDYILLFLRIRPLQKETFSDCIIWCAKFGPRPISPTFACLSVKFVPPSYSPQDIFLAVALSTGVIALTFLMLNTQFISQL